MQFDYQNSGFCFWRRSHQVPGVTCCWEHFTPLEKIQSTHDVVADSWQLFDAKFMQTKTISTVSRSPDETEIQFANFARDALFLKPVGSKLIGDLLRSHNYRAVEDYPFDYMVKYLEPWVRNRRAHQSLSAMLLWAYKLFGTVDAMVSSVSIMDGYGINSRLEPGVSPRYRGRFNTLKC